MVHGMQDYGIYASKTTVVALDDMAELAARLGSIVTYDRKGDVILLDDYEEPLEKFRDSSQALAEVKLDSTVAVSGAQCVKLTTPATQDRYAEFSYVIPPYHLGRHGIKVSFSAYEMVNLTGYYQIYGLYYDGSHSYEFGIRVNPKAEKVQVYTSGGWTDAVTNLFIDTSLETWWHNLKLVIDLDIGYYTKLLIDATDWDLSSYPFIKLSDTTYTLFELYFTLNPDAANILTLYQDDFVYTINEP